MYTLFLDYCWISYIIAHDNNISFDIIIVFAKNVINVKANKISAGSLIFKQPIKGGRGGGGKKTTPCNSSNSSNFKFYIWATSFSNGTTHFKWLSEIKTRLIGQNTHFFELSPMFVATASVKILFTFFQKHSRLIIL